jgi:hypothetical protein
MGAAVGGCLDIVPIPYLYEMVVEDLGYPEYFLIILGVWKLAGGMNLLILRFPRLKEWAHAGAFFNYTGAVASHIAVVDGLLVWWGPAGFAVVLMVSWRYDQHPDETFARKNPWEGTTPSTIGRG